MLALLPILIFDSAFNIKYFEFKKHFPEIMALALPCFVVGFAILGVVLYYSIVIVVGYDKWTLFVCLMYSAMISATDPVAVVMLLSKLNVPHRLRLLLEGESLLNDGMALILYSIADALVRDQLGQPGPHGLLLTIVYLLLHSIYFKMRLGTHRNAFADEKPVIWFFPWSYTVMLTWSGLRGSIALLLAIRTNDEDLFGQIAPLACGCVAFTVLVTNFYHTFTATATATILNLTQLSQTKKKRIKLLIKDINAFVKSVRDTYVNAQMGFWNEVLWSKVEQLSTMEHESEEVQSPTVGDKNPRIFSLLNYAFRKLPIYSVESPTIADRRRQKS
uniref:Cation/H+ exchanger domain-containing protein n=1 Tax=Romanomermis culicivorax TaxID=13658 RepID=A0A915KZL4_ROMCU